MKIQRWGQVKYRGTVRTLLCDWDVPHPPTLPMIWRVLARQGLRPVFIEYDRTARGWHGRIVVNRALTSGETVALQLLLCSDRYREGFNLHRVLSGARPRDWNILFEKKLG